MARLIKMVMIRELMPGKCPAYNYKGIGGTYADGVSQTR